MIALIFLLGLVYISLNPELLSETVVTLELENITEVNALNLSLSPYVDNLSAYLGETIELKAFLFRSSSESDVSVVKTYIVDDDDLRIEIIVLDANHRSLLPVTGRSEDIYLVSGVVEEDIVDNLRFIVRTLTVSDRNIEEIVSQEWVNKTVLVERNSPFVNTLRDFTTNTRALFK